MATYFVSNGTIDGAPNNANDGLDALGIELSSAAYDDVGGAGGDYRVFSGSSFGDYTWASGDRIYLTGASITDGLYEVASKLDDDVIFLTESAGGDSAVDSSDGPWATIQHGVDNAEAGDELVICGASDYTPTSTIAIDTNTTTDDSPLFIWGATARGVIDGTRATIDGSGISYSDAVDINVSSMTIMSHLEIKDANRNAIEISAVSNLRLNNCRITGSFDAAVALENASAVSLYGCEIDDNEYGVLCNSSWRGPLIIVNCSIHDNSDSGVVWAYGATSITNTLFYLNAGSGAERVSSSQSNDHIQVRFVNCTFFKNTGAGIDFVDSATGNTLVASCVFRDNGTYGLDLAGEPDNVKVVTHCCFHGNDSGISDVVFRDDGSNIYVDPEFESETAGSEDLSPDSDSPLIGAGCNWTFSEGGTQHLDIGALQRGAS